MSTMILPTGWVKYRQADGSITWSRTGHSAAFADLVIFKATDGSPTSKYQIKGVLGHDPSQLTLGDVVPNSIIEINVRQVNDMPSADRTDFNTLLDNMGDLISSVQFQADLEAQLLPYEGNQI